MMTEWLFSSYNSAVQDGFLSYKIMTLQILYSDLEFVLRYSEFHLVKEKKKHITQTNLLFEMKCGIKICIKFNYNSNTESETKL